MPTQLQLRRGTTTEHSTFSGAVGEVTVDTTKDTLIVHDGATNGGFPLAKEAGATFGNTNVTGDFSFAANAKAQFGAGSDLQIYHDGSNSYIVDNGTGDLVINTNGNAISLNPNGGGEYGLRVINNGAVNLYHDNALKLATTNTGVDVTGAISSNKGSAGTLATFSDGVNSNFVVETSSLLTTIGNGGGSAALALKANNTEAMRIDSSGQVGLSGGTASFDPTGSVNGLQLYYQTSNGQAIIGSYSAGGNTELAFHTNTGGGASTAAMLITSAGSVGIGGSPSGYGKLVSLGGDNATLFAAVGSTNMLRVQGYNSTYLGTVLEAVNLAQSANTPMFINASEVKFGISGSERMCINSLGNVGIGTCLQSSQLSFGANIGRDFAVYESTGGANKYGIGMGGDGSGGNPFRTKIYANGNESVSITAAGNVGIGVTPTTRFDVGDSSSNTVARVRNLNGGGTNTNATLQLSTSNNYVNLQVNEQYNYSQFQQAGNLVNHYSDVDNHVFRNKAGTQRLVLSSTGKLETSGRDFGFHNHGTNVSLADDASIVINASTAGGGILAIYETASGQWAVFGVGYNGATIMSSLNETTYGVTDTDGRVCVIPSGHTITIKNRLGGTKSFYINMFMAGNNFAG